jgi:butyryl-CoA dehydrogenase
MRSGEWQGTMALTEPEAGSSLSDITTMAEPTEKGYYRIKGQAFLLYINEIEDTIGAAQQYNALKGFANDLNTTLTDLQDVTQHLVSIAQQQGPEAFLADATLYLEFFSIVTIAWQWLLQGVAVQKVLNNGAKKTDQNFYQGKMFTLRYFFAYELPKTLGLARRLLDEDRLTVEMQTDFFND